MTSSRARRQLLSWTSFNFGSLGTSRLRDTTLGPLDSEIPQELRDFTTCTDLLWRETIQNGNYQKRFIKITPYTPLDQTYTPQVCRTARVYWLINLWVTNDGCPADTNQNHISGVCKTVMITHGSKRHCYQGPSTLHLSSTCSQDTSQLLHSQMMMDHHLSRWKAFQIDRGQTVKRHECEVMMKDNHLARLTKAKFVPFVAWDSRRYWNTLVWRISTLLFDWYIYLTLSLGGNRIKQNCWTYAVNDDVLSPVRLQLPEFCGLWKD